MFSLSSFFFFNDTATTEIYTLSLHDALPIWSASARRRCRIGSTSDPSTSACRTVSDRKSTRLNSSHSQISYAVFCLKKKKKYYILFLVNMFEYSLYNAGRHVRR